MNSTLRRLVRDRQIRLSRDSKGMVQKELEGAETDLKEARESLDADKHKWATVQAYYSAFHSARALLYAKGFREKSHRGLLEAIRQLYAREIPKSTLDAFADAMRMREAADYGLVYSEEGAHTSLEIAEEFFEVARKILRTGRRSSHLQRSILPYLGKLKGPPAPKSRSRPNRRGRQRHVWRENSLEPSENGAIR